MDENEIIPYIEPIYRFCYKRLSQRYDAEDLASEIICHILDGMKKYSISSLDAWVWRIAHNRYARFIDARNREQAILAENEVLCSMADSVCWHVDEEETEQEFDTVFRYLHTLSAEYRNIFIDYYIGEMSIRELSKKYSLPETTVKWRLNEGRRKIRKRKSVSAQGFRSCISKMNCPVLNTVTLFVRLEINMPPISLSLAYRTGKIPRAFPNR